MIDYDKYWALFGRDVKTDFLNSMRTIQEKLDHGSACQSLSTCPKMHFEQEATQVGVEELVGYGKAKLSGECRVCSIFPELRPNQEQIYGIRLGDNFCPCMIFGREDAMNRLAMVIERLEQEA